MGVLGKVCLWLFLFLWGMKIKSFLYFFLIFLKWHEKKGKKKSMLKTKSKHLVDTSQQQRQKVASPGIASRVLQLPGATLLYFINPGFIQNWRWQCYIHNKCILFMPSSSQSYEGVLLLRLLLGNEVCHTSEWNLRLEITHDHYSINNKETILEHKDSSSYFQERKSTIRLKQEIKLS